MTQSISKRSAVIVPLLTALFVIYLLGVAHTNASRVLAWTNFHATDVVLEQSDLVSRGDQEVSRYTLLSELATTNTVNDDRPTPGQVLTDALSINNTSTIAVTGNEATTPIVGQSTVSPAATTYTYLPLIMAGPGPGGTPPPGGSASPGDCLSAEEFELVNLINQYRNANGLSNVPVSKSLTQVAQLHVIDLHDNNPDSGSDHGYSCNMHSWSDKGVWSPVCYTGDHFYASGMWDKPREITSYTGNGYENAYGAWGQATASGALNAWKGSSGHRDVILEQGIWSGSNWPAMGVGIYQHHAVLWFGHQTDPQGTITQTCNVYN